MYVEAKPKKFKWTAKISNIAGRNHVGIQPIDELSEAVGPQLSFDTNSAASTAYSISYKGLGLSYSKSASIEEEHLNGQIETETTDIFAFLDFGKLSMEYFFIDQTGFILSNPSEVIANWSDESVKPSYEDMRVQTSGFSVLYTTSPDSYSVSQITNQVEKIDKKLGFSWIGGLQTKRTIIKNIPTIDVSTNNDQTIEVDDISIASFTFFGGFGVHLGISNFYVAPAFLIGIPYVRDLSDGDGKSIDDDSTASKIIFPFGFHSDSFFFGFTTINSTLPINQEDNRVAFSRSTQELFIGTHF